MSRISCQDIEKGERHQPPPITDIPPEYEIASGTGTIIVLSKLKKRIQSSIDSNLRKRIARRFSIWSEDFNVLIDGEKVSITDRDYFDKLEYILVYGDYEQSHLDHLREKGRLIERSHAVDKKGIYEVKGWIGLVEKSGSLQEEDDNLNKLAIRARGKIASEDILEIFREGGLYTKYLIGELEADFLDSSDRDDIATSSRQDFLRDDERFIALREFAEKELKFLEKQRAKYKQKEGVKKAEEIPEIKEWLRTLKGDARKAAKKLFGRINTMVIDEQHRRTLYQHGVLAFAHLHHKEKLNELDHLDIHNLETAVRLFSELDDIEASWYHKITQGRLNVVRKLKEHVKDNALERVIQKHIYLHLWLLDPSWDRATETASLEEDIKVVFARLSEDSPEEEKKGRIDIRYKKSSGKHIIIELKRASVKTETLALLTQVKKYREAVRQEVESARDNADIETICLLGTELKDCKTQEGRNESRKMLEASNTRVVTYKQLIRDAEISYSNYLEKSKERGRINKLLEAIEQHTSP